MESVNTPVRTAIKRKPPLEGQHPVQPGLAQICHSEMGAEFPLLERHSNAPGRPLAGFCQQ